MKQILKQNLNNFYGFLKINKRQQIEMNSTIPNKGILNKCDTSKRMNLMYPWAIYKPPKNKIHLIPILVKLKLRHAGATSRKNPKN